MLYGDYECKLDSKGRLILPAALRKLFSPEAKDVVWLNMGPENCLNMYPDDEWQLIQRELNKLNKYKRENIEFLRIFTAGLTRVQLDPTGRLNIPKRLMDYANIKTDAFLFSLPDRVEIWEPTYYKEKTKNPPPNYAELQENVLGGVRRDTNTNNDGNPLAN